MIYCVDYKKTSLRPYIEIFEKFVNSLIIESQKIKRGKYSDSKCGYNYAHCSIRHSTKQHGVLVGSIIVLPYKPICIILECHCSLDPNEVNHLYEEYLKASYVWKDIREDEDDDDDVL